MLAEAHRHKIKEVGCDRCGASPAAMIAAARSTA
jgi:hypothetical protein